MRLTLPQFTSNKKDPHHIAEVIETSTSEFLAQCLEPEDLKLAVMPTFGSIVKAADEESGNQYFIATHNPYLLNSLIENSDSKELSVFVCGFDKEKGTTANKLSDSDLSELLDYGVDIFFNINRYLDDGVKHSS